MKSERVNEFISAVKKAVEGDYSIRLPLSGEDDPLDQLVEGINQLVVNLQQMEDEQKKTESHLKETTDNLYWQSEELKARNEEFLAYNTYLLNQQKELRRLSQQAEAARKKTKRSEEELRKKNEFLNTILESLSHPFYVINTKDFTVALCNSAAQTTDSLKGSTCYALTHDRKTPCDSHEHPCPLQQVVQTKQPAVVEHIHHDNSGKVIHLEVHSFPILDEKGDVDQIIEYTLDITKRKTVEKALREREEIELQYQHKLKTLTEVNNELSTIASFDELCRRAVELGQSRLGFERLGIWFVDTIEPNTMQGTFGIDETGQIRDERDQRLLVSEYEEIQELRTQKERYLLQNDHPLFNQEHIVVGRGSAVSTGIWDGDSFMGYITIDNLLRGQPIYERDCELLCLYAATLGRLCSQKRAEEALRAERDRAQMYLDIAGVILLALDTECNVTLINKKGCQILGYCEDEILGKNWIDNFLPYQSRETLRTVIENTLSGALNLYEIFENPIVTKSGEERIIYWHNSLLKDYSGAITGLFSSGEDITERKQAEESLLESEERIRTISLYAQDAILMMDSEGRISFWNNAAETIFGWTKEEAIGKDMHKLLAPKKYHVAFENGFKQFQQTGEGGAIGQFLELSAMRRDGTEFPIEISLAAMNLKGKWNAIGIIRDITERKQVEEQLNTYAQELERTNRSLEKARLEAEKANIAKSEFLANMSHEIRTPMNGIVGMTDLLLGASLSAQQRDYAETIANSASALLTILNDILDFSKIEAGKLEIESIPFNLRTIVEQVGQLIGVKAPEKNIDLMIRYMPDVPSHFIGDPVRIRQVLMNLVGNAVKFTEKGYVLIDVDCKHLVNDKAIVRIRVEDTGAGIARDKQQTIFKQFSQADTSITRRYGGTGLGLAISRQLVKIMGGKLEVESTLGIGSIFQFKIKLRLHQQDEEKIISKVPLAGLRAIVVDDNAINRRIIIEYLSKWDVPCDPAVSGKEALAMMRNAHKMGYPYHIALLDHHMAEMDGVQLAKTIKQDSCINDIILLLLSSAIIRRDSRFMKETGFSSCLRKPVRSSDLLDSLMQCWFIDQQHTQEKSTSSPILKEEREPEQTTGEKPQQIAARILLVEDNQVNQEVAKAILENLGCQVEIVDNGKKAVKAVRRFKYDLVFMDCSMPVMDGFEAVKKIRNLETDARDTLIVAMTAYAMEGDRQKCLNAGMNDYLSKPIRKDTVKAILLKYCASENSVPPIDPAPQEEPSRVEGRDVYEKKESDTFNPRNLIKELDGELELVQEIIQIFLDDTPEIMQQLKESVEAEDLNQIEKNSHKLGGMAINIGASQLRELAYQMERMAEEDHLERCAALLPALLKAFAQLKDTLRKTDWENLF